MYQKGMLALALAAVSLPGWAASYSILSADSYVSVVSGSVDVSMTGTLYGFPFSASGGGGIAEQAPGSLTTSLSGSLDATATGSTLTFSSSVIAGISGNWQPLNVPANLGFQSLIAMSSNYGPLSASVYGAARDIAFDLGGAGSLSGPAGNQSLTVASPLFTVTAGLADAQATMNGTTVSVIGTPISSYSFVLQPLGGSLVTVGNTETLTLFFDISSQDTETVPYSDATSSLTATVTTHLHRQGQLVATRELQPVPIPAAAWLLGSGLLGLIGVARRKA